MGDLPFVDLPDRLEYGEISRHEGHHNHEGENVVGEVEDSGQFNEHEELTRN